MDAAKLVAFLLKTERPAPALEGMWGVHAELPGGRTPLALRSRETSAAGRSELGGGGVEGPRRRSCAAEARCCTAASIRRSR